jgi:hypothetical protein
MGWLDSLFGAGAGSAAKGVGELAGDVRQAITGELPPEMRIRQSELLAEGDKAQVELDKLDIASNSFFQRGWRPLAGWVCALGLAYEYILYPFLRWGSDNGGLKFPPPQLNMETMLPLLFGMLGLAATRSYDKAKAMENK